jgi:hypothetical protein
LSGGTVTGTHKGRAGVALTLTGDRWSEQTTRRDGILRDFIDMSISPAAGNAR